MLTRLKVSGFKNLIDVDIRFGPFTCIAGANGVGKSNLFDAIRFLSALANHPLIDAALSVRAESGNTGDLRNIFHRLGDKYAETMSFEAEMIIPKEGIDDLGQKATASMTFLRYSLIIGYYREDNLSSLGKLKLVEEKLEHINRSEAPKFLKFPHSAGKWRKSVLHGRRNAPYISTEFNKEGNPIIKLAQDGSGGMPKSFLMNSLPRTVLSTVNATESPTALIARREMQSWRLLQLEPTALREPDSFITSPGLSANGAHIPATLFNLSKVFSKDRQSPESWIYEQIGNRLSELIDDVHAVFIDKDDKRELLTLSVKGHDGTVHPARSLSDGTLRFLALAVIELDPTMSGLICLEEPENGIHPDRITAILDLLKDIAIDPFEPAGSDNPLRQVIVNTHSPWVVKQVPDDSLLIAELQETIKNDRRCKGVRFGWLPETWRAEAAMDISPVAKGKILSYLTPEPSPYVEDRLSPKSRRVMDRPDFQRPLPFEQP
ncbi:MAG: AAA family ATPase [Thermodesulfobacteriota bacterium]